MKKIINTFLLGILAGFSIASGGLLYVVLVSKGKPVIGSFAFSIGLLLVCLFGLNLFTGKIGFILDSKSKGKYLLDLLIMYIGNFIGALAIGYFSLAIFSSNSDVMLSAHNIAATRNLTSDNYWQSLASSIACGMLVYTAVYGFKKEWPIGIKVVVLMFSVFAFVISGFQHCIANMFYISFAHAWNANMLLNILTITIGNSIGALLLNSLALLIKKLKENQSAE